MEVAAATFNYGYSNYDAGAATNVTMGTVEAVQCRCCGWRDAVMVDGGQRGGSGRRSVWTLKEVCRWLLELGLPNLAAPLLFLSFAKKWNRSKLQIRPLFYFFWKLIKQRRFGNGFLGGGGIGQPLEPFGLASSAVQSPIFQKGVLRLWLDRIPDRFPVQLVRLASLIRFSELWFYYNKKLLNYLDVTKIKVFFFTKL